MEHTNMLKISVKVSIGILFSLSFLIFTTAKLNAAEIVIINMDSPGEGLNDQSAPFPNQAGNNQAATLGEQRLNVVRAAADYWEERLVSDVPIEVEISFDPLFCTSAQAALGGAAPLDISTLADLNPELLANTIIDPNDETFFVSALANSLGGEDFFPSADIIAEFNSSLDNNINCLGVFGFISIDWWYGVEGEQPAFTENLFSTVLHEIAHGLGFFSLIDPNNGTLPSNIPDSYSRNLVDDSSGQFLVDMSNISRLFSLTNSDFLGETLAWGGTNANLNSGHIETGRTVNDRLRIFAPSSLVIGSSVTHWDESFSPDELMEPSATPTTDDRSTLQLLIDIGWAVTIPDEDTNSSDDNEILDLIIPILGTLNR